MFAKDLIVNPRVSRPAAVPAEGVWAVLADGWLYASWVVGASRIRDVDASWPSPGARLHHSVGLWPALISDYTEVEVCDPPHHLVLMAHAGAIGSARVDLSIVPDGPWACTVTMAEDATSGLGRLLLRPARQAMILPRNHEALRRLVMLAEGQHRSGPRAGV